MSYDRASPSRRYFELQAMYREMHQKGEQFLGEAPEITFAGFSLDAQLARIKTLIVQTAAKTILDYGCGKGQQYNPRALKDADGVQWTSVMDFWKVDEITCYDPCYEPYSKLPKGKFDGVISTDVLEHCPQEDIPWIIDEIFDYAGRFVFANVACYAARKRLPNGENAHCTTKSIEWWESLFRNAALAYPDVLWEVWVQWKEKTPLGEKHFEQKINSP